MHLQHVVPLQCLVADLHLQRRWCSRVCAKGRTMAAYQDQKQPQHIHTATTSSSSQPAAAAAVAGSAGADPATCVRPQANYSSLAEELLDALRVPPLPRQLGPRVHHLTIQTEGHLSEVVAAALGVHSSLVMELMRFGALYHCPVMPLPADTAGMSSEQLASITAVRQAGLLRWGRSSVHQHPKRTLVDQGVAVGAYVRVHLHPKRFPAAYSVAWEKRILHNGPQLVVVDKPAGVQVPPTVDNLQESVEACTCRALGLAPGSLLTTHRLDAGTSGVVVLAKCGAAASWFQRLLADKQDCLIKEYRCVTAAPPPVGVLVHYANIGQRQPGEPAHTVMQEEATEGSARCELEVLQVQAEELTGQAAAEWGPVGHEVTIKLITGRTHQIRAQMAAVGCPLLGDLLYTGLSQRTPAADADGSAEPSGLRSDNAQQALQRDAAAAVADDAAAGSRPNGSGDNASGMQQPGNTAQLNEIGASTAGARDQSSSWSRAAQDDPLRPLALQAFRLTVLDSEGRFAACTAVPDEHNAANTAESQLPWTVFEAGMPWWRSTVEKNAAFSNVTD